MIREPLAPLEGRFVEIDGSHLYHRVCDRAGPTAPAVVHVHGFGISGSYLEPTAVRLVERARNYIPDLPGTGGSAQPAETPDIRSSAEALVRYCDAMELERATFVGNSLGCVTLIELADSYPDRVDGLVFVSPAGGPNNQPLPKALGQMMLDGVREPLGMARIATRDYLRFGLLQSLSLFRAMVNYPTLDRLALVDCPVLVVIGRKDPLVDASRVRALLQRDHVAAVTIDGAHALNFTKPEAVAGLITAHLDGAEFDDAAPADASVEVLFDGRVIDPR